MPESSDDKVFPASPRKRKEARKQGQVAKSPDLSGALVFLVIIVWIHFQLTSGNTLNLLLGDFQTAFSFNPHATTLNLATAGILMKQTSLWGARLVLPALMVGAIAGLLVNIGQVGLSFNPEALAPKFDRINIQTGLKRMLGAHGAVEVGKGLAKMTLLGYICYRGISDQMDNIISAAQGDLLGLISVVGDMIWHIGIKVACILFVLAVADYAYKKYEYEKNMMMTHQEMKQEIKQTDGDPLIKQRIRQKQRQIASRRMMQQVPKADVIITNPTHFAVALKYDGASMRAPTVIAKGQDLVALKIREIAIENKIPIVENKPLARALYAQVLIDREIPGELFQAVAEVLSFVYRTYGKSGARINGRSSYRKAQGESV